MLRRSGKNPTLPLTQQLLSQPIAPTMPQCNLSAEQDWDRIPIFSSRAANAYGDEFVTEATIPPTQ
jgi:hypothetical protein